MVEASELTFDAVSTAYRSRVGSITDALTNEIKLLQPKVAVTEGHSATLGAATTLALVTGSMDSIQDGHTGNRL